MTEKTSGKTNKPIKALTSSEQLVYEICQESFLSLWSYANPRRKENSAQELCDVLIVCDPHVIVISVKEIGLKDPDNPKVATRWERKAIADSIDQIKGAIGSLERLEYVIKKDGSLGHKLPPQNKRIYHRIAVAFGAKRKLPLSMTRNKDGNLFHVFDETTVLRLMCYLDTITDFTQYLIDKEDLLLRRKASVVLGGGEEDLLAVYLENDRSFPAGVESVLGVDSGYWDSFINSPEVIAKLKEDEVSYYWDNLIEQLYPEDMDFEGPYWDGANFVESEMIFRVLAKEDRFSRRLLSKAFVKFLLDCKGADRGGRCVKSKNNIIYIFKASDGNPETSEYRKDRLLRGCVAFISRFPKCQIVVGIDLILDKLEGYEASRNLVYLQAPNEGWSEEMLELSKSYQVEVLQEISVYENEYPEII